MIEESLIRDELKKQDKRFVEMFDKGVCLWETLRVIKVLRWCLGQKALTKSEKKYNAWGKIVKASFERGRQARLERENQ